MTSWSRRMLGSWSGPEMLDLALKLRPIRWVWTEKMLSMGGPQIVGYKRGTCVYGLDAQNVRSVLSERLLTVNVTNLSDGLLTVNYRVVAVVLFVAAGEANTRYRLLRPQLDRMVQHTGLRMISRWRLLLTLSPITLRDHCHDHLASLKWFVGQLEDLENKLRINSARPNI